MAFIHSERIRRAARVKHHGPVVAEQEIDEVALLAEALADAQHERIVVELMHLDQWIGGVGAVGSTMDRRDAFER
jgi:ribulose-5-phosphate 4-epimerase/fuculose-1-phosphate aldolase